MNPNIDPNIAYLITITGMFIGSMLGLFLVYACLIAYDWIENKIRQYRGG